METFSFIAAFTTRLFAPPVRPFRVGDQVLYKGRPGEVVRAVPVFSERVVDPHRDPYWRRCDKTQVSVRVAQERCTITAGVKVDNLYGNRNLKHKP